MMTKDQDKIIVEYILNKRLSYDIASEVYDHMKTQIHDLMSGGVSFDEAWQKTKDSWLSELKMTYDVRFSFDDISELGKKLIIERNKSILPKSILFGVVLSTLTLLLLFIIPYQFLELFQISFVIIFISALIYFLILNHRLKNKNRLSLKIDNPITNYQNLLVIPSYLGGFIASFLNINNWSSLQSIMISEWNLLSSNEILFLILSVIIFCLYYSVLVIGIKAYFLSKESFNKGLAFKEKAHFLLNS